MFVVLLLFPCDTASLVSFKKKNSTNVLLRLQVKVLSLKKGRGEKIEALRKLVDEHQK